jgi:hypothetical protein
MEAVNKATFVTVSQKSTHVGIGLNIDWVDEYQRFDICFVDGLDYWGVVVIDPDGKTTTVIKPRTVDGLEVNIEFDGRRLPPIIIYNAYEKGMYEIIL